MVFECFDISKGKVAGWEKYPLVHHITQNHLSPSDRILPIWTRRSMWEFNKDGEVAAKKNSKSVLAQVA